MVNPVPDGFNTVSVYLIVKDAKQAMDFYATAFGAEVTCLMNPSGESVMHADLKIGNSTVMLSEENPQWGSKSAETLGGSPASMHLCVEDVDASFKRALDAGCSEVAPVTDMFWGDRYGKVADPFGYQWGIATKIEEVSIEEMEKRAAAWFAQMASGQDQPSG